MPVYNTEKFIREAIESILHQTFKDFEFLIVNDCSKDSSLDIILSYNDPRIQLINNQKTLGTSGCLNKGLQIALGKYIARQDSDDISLPQRLEKEMNFLENNPEAGLVGTFFIAINEEGEFLQEFRPFTHSKDLKKKLLTKNPFAHGSVMFRRECIEKAGNYREDLKYFEDVDLWRRISQHFELANIPEPLYKWRLNTGSISVSHKHSQNLTNIKKDQRIRIISDYQYLGSCLLLNYRTREAREYYFRALECQKKNPKTWFLILISFVKPVLPKKIFRCLLTIFWRYQRIFRYHNY